MNGLLKRVVTVVVLFGMAATTSVETVEAGGKRGRPAVCKATKLRSRRCPVAAAPVTAARHATAARRDARPSAAPVTGTGAAGRLAERGPKLGWSSYGQDGCRPWFLWYQDSGQPPVAQQGR